MTGSVSILNPALPTDIRNCHQLTPPDPEAFTAQHHQAGVLDAPPVVALFGKVQAMLGAEDHVAGLPRPVAGVTRVSKVGRNPSPGRHVTGMPGAASGALWAGLGSRNTTPYGQDGYRY